jgi:hypothetical protein
MQTLFIILGAFAAFVAIADGLEKRRQARNREALRQALREAAERTWWRYASARLERNRK